MQLWTTASRADIGYREDQFGYVGKPALANDPNTHRRIWAARKLHLSLLVLLLAAAVMVPTKVESQANLQLDAPSGPIDFLLVLTRDGVVRVSLNGNKQLLIPDVGASYSLEVQDENIYVSNQTYGGAILKYDLQGDLQRTIPTPPQANRYLDFVVLPGDRFALMDNDNDKIFISNGSGQLLATINIRDTPDIQGQCLDGLVVGNQLIFAEDGDQQIFRVDLSTYQKSLLKDMSGVDGWGVCTLGFFDGHYYTSLLKFPNNKLYRFADSGTPSLIAEIPGAHTTGIVVNGNTVYASVNSSGTIYAVNVLNGSNTVVATGLNYPKDLEGVVAPTYNVTGRVLDTEGTPIQGVLVSDNVGHGATTDSSGNYSLTGLSRGTYTVTPGKSGYVFCPRNRQVNVSSNVSGQDFSGSLSGSELGFCPEPNGFGFPNAQLWRTWPMFEQYYGPAAVHNTDGGICAAAQRYFDRTYRAVANGWSCVGFTLGSLHSFQSRPQPNAGPFAIAPYSNLYQQPLSSQLTSPIAYYSGVQLSEQYLNEYQSWLATCAADPNQMVARLQQAIQAGNPLLLSLKAGNAYHAIAPYRVVTVSPTETHIYVYDSETPGQQRVVRMQRSGSGWQWQYTFVGSMASAGTRTGGCSDMFYFQASASLERGLPLVDLCAEARGAAPDGTGKLLSVLPAAGNWYLQDSAGRRLGWAGGQWVSEIPEGYELPQTVSDAVLSHRLLYLPAGAYTVRTDAGASRVVDYSLFADGRVLQVDGQAAAAGVTSTIDVSPGLDAISVTQLSQFTSLAVELVRELPTASRVAGFSGSAVTGNAELGITFDDQALELSRASGTMSYRLRFFQPGTNTGYFASEVITLEPDEAHRLTPATWNGLSTGTVLLEIDEGRDGTVDETVTLTNEARSLYLPIVLSIR